MKIIEALAEVLSCNKIQLMNVKTGRLINTFNSSDSGEMATLKTHYKNYTVHSIRPAFEIDDNKATAVIQVWVSF